MLQVAELKSQLNQARGPPHPHQHRLQDHRSVSLPGTQSDRPGVVVPLVLPPGTQPTDGSIDFASIRQSAASATEAEDTELAAVTGQKQAQMWQEQNWT